MANKKRQHIYLLKDENGYLYEWQTKLVDPDSYDHRRFTILRTRKPKKQD